MCLGALAEIGGPSGCGGGNLDPNLKILASNVLLSTVDAAALKTQSDVDTNTKVLAENVVYDNANSTLASDTAQGAFDELAVDYATAIIGTWSGYIICSVPGDGAGALNSLGFAALGSGTTVVKLDSETLTFTAQSDSTDGTYAFSKFNSFFPQTGGSAANLSDSYWIDGKTVFFKRTIGGGSSSGRLPSMSIVGNTMQFDGLEVSGPIACSGNLTKS